MFLQRLDRLRLHEIAIMTSLFDQLIEAGFPGDQGSAAAVAVELFKCDLTDVQDLAAVEKADLELVVGRANATQQVLKWLLQIATQQAKHVQAPVVATQQCAPRVLKRVAETVDAANLEQALGNAP